MNPLQKFKSIVVGITNAHIQDPEIEKEAFRRAKICSECKHANPDHPFQKMMPDKSIQFVSAMGCNICHCLIPAKTRSPMERCPEKKW